MSYLYRFDTLNSLRAQLSDPVLRAKRVTKAHGAFDHHQVLAELAAVNGTRGVYRFCFWRHWDAVVKHFHGTAFGQSPWIVQRVREDHPTFAKFNKDEDEYLPNQAWIYWQSNHIDPERPDWSPDGISHEDMEVLTPSGHWERLATSDLMRDATLDSWRCFPLRGIGGPAPIYARTLCRWIDGENQVWVHIRQQNGPWTAIWRNAELLAEAVSLMLADFRAFGFSQVRWVVSLECDDRVLSAEFRPRFRMPKLSFLARTLGHRRLGVEDLEVFVDEDFHILDAREQRQLYGDFGITEVLLLHRRYDYADHLLNDARKAQLERMSS